MPPVPPARVIDSLMLARKKHPNAQNSLDALCSRYGIDTSKRTLHGGLLDAQLLAEVYLELIGGRQPDLILVTDEVKATSSTVAVGEVRRVTASRPVPLAPRMSEEERAAHAAFIGKMNNAIWSSYLEEAPPAE